MKRALDIIVSLVALIVFSPILVYVGILVAIKLGWPIIFTQLRPGKNKKGFKLYKFRSMTNDVDENGNLLPNEDRLTDFGKWLRKTSLDELPSIWNVLKGDMSLVGPRPLRIRYNDYFTPAQDVRHNVKPGVTGWAQINGRTAISWDEKFELDAEYVRRQSLIFDFQILVKTVLVVFKKENTTPAYADFEIPFDEYVKQKHEPKG